jgi:hypothetical protein
MEALRRGRGYFPTTEDETMKPIWTTNCHGKARATDRDGNSAWMSTADCSYEEGHAAVCRRLCEKMGWSGTLRGHWHLAAGRTEGMIWTWDDENAPKVTVTAWASGENHECRQRQLVAIAKEQAVTLAHELGATLEWVGGGWIAVRVPPCGKDGKRRYGRIARKVQGWDRVVAYLKVLRRGTK